MKNKKLWIAIAGLAVALGGALLYAKSFKPVAFYLPVAEIDRLGQASGLTDCFWIGNYSENKGSNYAFPDTGANYWISQFKLPPGAQLELDGEFAHARHMSFNAYDDLGQPVDRLNDTMLVPQPGSANPFLGGAQRGVTHRAYSIRIAAADIKAGAPIAERDATRPPNTLYVPTDSDTVQLFLRIYVQDKGLTPMAGVALPQPRMRLADGTTVQGGALCKAIVVKEKSLRDIHLTQQAAATVYTLQNTTTAYHPAQAEPKWTAFLNPPMTFASVLDGTAFEWIKGLLSHQRKGGFYSTLDNTYMVAFVDKRIGDVLVLQGKAPTTPKTFNGGTTMQDAQLRYWSFCKYRSLYDTAVDSCVYDEQAPVNPAGEYTIVFSAPELRPANAKTECGVAWRPWGPGDSLGNPDGGMLVYRHMMPSPDFKQSIFATQGAGDEKQVLGPYYPRSAYQARAAFEARGCPVR